MRYLILLFALVTRQCAALSFVTQHAMFPELDVIGKRKRVNWNEVYQHCVPRFSVPTLPYAGYSVKDK